MSRSAGVAIAVLLTLCLLGVASAGGGFGPAQGNPVPTLASLGANLQGVCAVGSSTTTGITSSGLNFFGASGVLTQVLGTANFDEAVTMDTTLGVTTSVTSPSYLSAAAMGVTAGDALTLKSGATDDNVILQSGNSAGESGDVTVESGTSGATSPSGEVLLQSGATNDADSGAVEIGSGDAGGTNQSGDVLLEVGSASTPGSISIAETRATSLSMGHSGGTTTIGGSTIGISAAAAVTITSGLSDDDLTLVTGDTVANPSGDWIGDVGSAGSGNPGEVRLATTNAFGLVLGHASMANGLQIVDGVRIELCNTEDDGGAGVAFADTINLVSLDQKTAAALNIGTVTAQSVVVGVADSELRLVGAVNALTGGSQTTDASPTDLVITAEDAYDQASGGNREGSDIRLAPGLGSRVYTIDDYTLMAGDTVTVTVNGSGTTLTEGVTPNFDALTSNDVTATNLALAVSAVGGVTAVAVSNVVHVKPDRATYSLVLTEASDGASATNNADGVTSATSVHAPATGGNFTILGQARLVQAGPELSTNRHVAWGNPATWTMDSFLGRASAGVLRIGGTKSTATGTLQLKDLHAQDDGRVILGTGEDVKVQGELTTLTHGSPTTVLSVTLEDGDYAGIKIEYFLECDDGTDGISEVGTLQLSLSRNVANGVEGSEPGEVSVQHASNGSDTATTVWTFDDTDDSSVEITLDVDVTGFTPSTCQVRWKATYSGNISGLTVP